MKKTQVALAALALVASSAALADVSIYGTIDAGIANTSGKGVYLDGTGGWNAGNWIGFKGTEDLNGLKADFVLEAGINTNGLADNGGFAESGVLFNRQSYVGLSGDFGAVRLGQQLSPYIGALASGTAGNGHFFVNRIILGGGFGNAAVDTNAGAGASSFSMGGFFIPNAVSYSTPSIGGFSATVLTSTKGANGGAVPTTINSDKYSAAAVSGSVAGVNLNVGYQDRSATYKSSTLSASYPMGDLTIAGNYTRFKGESTEAVNSYSLSGAYQLNSALSVNLQYARNNLDNAQALTSVGAAYTLSKRTSLYATYGRATNGAQSAYATRGSYATTGANNNTTAVGIVHSF